MKIYISVDMEGLPGVTSWEHVDERNKKYAHKILTEVVEWLVDEIKRSEKNEEITNITIADSHNFGENIPYDITYIDERIELISGYPRRNYMMPDMKGDEDVVFFIGYHAGVGALHGILDHSYSSTVIHSVYINEKKINETLLNAIYAGTKGVPVGLIMGDEALRREIIDSGEMSWVEFVVTKQGLGRFSARHRSKKKVEEDLRRAVSNVLNRLGKIPPYRIDPPYRLRIVFQTSGFADLAQLIPHVDRKDGRTVEFTSDDFEVILNTLHAITAIAYTGVNSGRR